MASSHDLARSPRFPPLSADALTEEQKGLVEEHVRSGRRTRADVADGKLGGALDVTLRSPALARLLSSVLLYFRNEAALPSRLMELTILVVAHAWESPFQWQVHQPMAIKAGVSEAAVRAIANNQQPSSLQPDEAIVYKFLTELHRSHSVSDETYAAMKTILDERGILDLVGLSGYYTLMAQIHGVAELGDRAWRSPDQST